MIDGLIEFLIYAILPYYQKKKKREEEWYGVVEEKKVKSNYSVSKYKCYVIFRKDDGQKIKMKINEEDLNKYEEGKRYHKRSGEDFPEAISEDY